MSQVRHAREEAGRRHGGIERHAGLLGGNSGTADLKGIHDTVRNIQAELEGMRNDIKNSNIKNAPSDGASASKHPPGIIKTSLDRQWENLAKKLP